MSTPPSPTPAAPPTGRVYWRSPEQLARTPEFRQWLEREFPECAGDWQDAVSRRHFLRIMSASFLLAGLGVAGGGCRRPEERIVPFARQPEGYVHGQPQYFATAMPTPTGAVPLVVKTCEGRPIKIEGNDRFPGGNGGTDRHAQASLLGLYDPDRARRFTNRGRTISREEALEFLARLAKQFRATGGDGVAFLMEPGTSPSRRRLQALLSARLPRARWFLHDPVESALNRRIAATAVFDQEAKVIHTHWGHTRDVRYRLDRASCILALDCDFLGSEDNTHELIRDFARGRKLAGPRDSMSRLYVVESLMTLTGAQADHRLRVPSCAVAGLGARIAAEVARLISHDAPWPGEVTRGLAGSAGAQDAESKWARACAHDLVANRGRAVVLAGHRQPVQIHRLAHILNALLGAVGHTVEVLELPAAGGPDQVLPDWSLARALNDGRVETLVILGANPVYSAAADLEWAKAQRKAKTVVRLGGYEDETFPLCDWHFPQAHHLESWGDARTCDGTLVPVQPLIAPLFGGLTELEFLARLAGEPVTNAYEIVRETFRLEVRPADFEEEWKRFLFDGFRAGTAFRPVQPKLSPERLKELVRVEAGVRAPSATRLEVVFHRDHRLDDGRYANNGWLQELPDPITKIVWDNAVLLSRKTARELGVRNGDVVEVSVKGRSIKGPVWVQPGMADYSLGLALGHGRWRAGRVGDKVGFNAYALRTSDAPHFALGATVRKTGESYPLACTQDHWSLEGRPIVRETNLEQFRRQPDFAKRLNHPEPPGGLRPLYPNPLDREKLKAHHQWGMSIDLNACVGCSACVVACQSENNIPIVGKEQVRRGREMHWLRIDRYYAGDPAGRGDKDTWKPEAQQQFESWIDEPQVVMQPMLCQHCEAAPCENVCPVNATVHDQEGLNVMAYNRCIGARYCSNNCPFKVRRFNYFDYPKRPLDKLYRGPLARRPDDERELLQMLNNPDVTVRMRGVMEKCTYCVQRIQQAKIARKVRARDSGDVVVPDGAFTTACAQACPAGAIVFGNIADPESRVSKLKRQERDYAVLEFLNLKPRTTYLARVRNPNPAMPDYRAEAATLRECEAKGGRPPGGHGGALPTGRSVEKRGGR